MKEYYLKVLLSTSEDHLRKREQYLTKTVLAEGVDFKAQGRVYRFWMRNEEDNSLRTVAMYPTNCTIIEKIL